jgi:hypothetical protein
VFAEDSDDCMSCGEDETLLRRQRPLGLTSIIPDVNSSVDGYYVGRLTRLDRDCHNGGLPEFTPAGGNSHCVCRIVYP